MPSALTALKNGMLLSMPLRLCASANNSVKNVDIFHAKITGYRLFLAGARKLMEAFMDSTMNC
jgi:cellobiose-specific phosphotransferase system component IIC